MSLADNRVHLNDCEDNNQVSADTTAAPSANSSDAGSFIEGSQSISFQCADAQEVILWEDDSGGTLLNVDMETVTVYMNVKHNLGRTFAGLGGQIAFGDGLAGAGGDIIGYNVAGSDVSGFPYLFRYTSIKLDVSVVVAAPGTDDVDYYTYDGVEANLDHAAVLQIGYGTFNVEKVVSTGKNAWMDGIYYIENSVSSTTGYAVSIQGGTGGTPETMVDVAADDVAVGMGLFNNPKGSEYGFFGPTEWGDPAADSYFTSEGEQWYLIGDNNGGHIVAANHFPFRLVGDSGSTNSWVLNSTVIVNTGRRAQFYMNNVDMDIVTMDGCSMIGLDTIELPDGSITTGFTTNGIFSDCNTITNHGKNMDGCNILGSIVAADTGALVYDEASDPDGTLDNLTIESGAAAHHAIDFGTNVDSSLVSITLRGMKFNGFGAVDDADASTIRFLATSGSITLNLIDCLVDGISPVASGGSQNFSVDDAAGITVTVVVQPVTLTITVKDKLTLAVIQDVQTSIHLKDSPFTELMNEDTTAGGIATESYAGATPVDVVWKTRKSEDTDNPRYKANSSIETITSNGLEITVLLEQNSVLN